jgi:mRNA interferase HigB
MRVISRKTLAAFWARSGRRDAEQPLRAWCQEVEKAAWRGPHDLKARYPFASILKGSRVVFNIGGNKYRLIVSVHYGTGIVYIRFVGTHAEYDRVDAEKV